MKTLEKIKKGKFELSESEIVELLRIDTYSLAGVNQLYAEMGAGPRDTAGRTEQSRGFDPAAAWSMSGEFGYYPPAL